METKEMTCIGCPLGCSLVAYIDGQDIKVSGNTCINGEKYAKSEITNPTRVVTSTIKVLKGKGERVSCKSASPIPKSKIFDCMKEIKKAQIVAPIKIGDILISDVADTKVDIIATKNIERI